MFAIKRLAGEFLYPLNAWVLVSVLGIVLCVWRPRRLAGTLVLLAGTLGLLIASLPAFGFLLLGYLEARAGAAPDLQDPSFQGIPYVVVLGNVHEGVRAWRQLPGSTLIISSGSFTSTLVERARALGVPDTAIKTESRGRDTQEQAVKLKNMLQGERFVLSTWALHMQRTVLIFQKQGLDPVPAPSDYLSRAQPSARWFVPSVGGMALTRHALHELVGTAWVLLQSL